MQCVSLVFFGYPLKKEKGFFKTNIAQDCLPQGTQFFLQDKFCGTRFKASPVFLLLLPFAFASFVCLQSHSQCSFIWLICPNMAKLHFLQKHWSGKRLLLTVPFPCSPALRHCHSRLLQTFTFFLALSGPATSLGSNEELSIIETALLGVQSKAAGS